MLIGLGPADIIVIGLYVAVTIGIGMWASRRTSTEEDYFLAGRRFGKFIQTFTAFGQGTNVESPVGVSATTFTNGAAGIWSSLTYLFTTPLYWLIAPWMRRLRVLTMADYFEERYGSRAIAGLYTLVAATVMIAHLSVGFHAASKTVMALAPKDHEQFTVAEQREYAQAEELQQLRARDYSTLSEREKERLIELGRLSPRKFFSHIDKETLIWITCTIVMIYGVTGGLAAAALTDALQGMCIIVLTVLLFPFCWGAINIQFGGQGIMGALRTVHDRLPESYFEILGSPSTMDFTWYYILALSLMAVSNTPAQAAFLTSNASAKNEFACRFGATVGSYIKRFCAVLWGFFALCALVLYHDTIHDPDLLWGHATLELLGHFRIGLVGLMISCLFTALMSTADTLMITSSGLLTKNVYRMLIPSRSEKHYVFVGRILGGVVVMSGAFIAVQFDGIWPLLKLMMEINIMIAATWWLGLTWRRANKSGAWVSMVTAVLFFFLLPLLLPAAFPSLKTDPYLLKSTQVHQVTRTYHAHEMDVERRDEQIADWEATPDTQGNVLPKPVSLTVGDEFDKTVILPPKSIFWTKGIKPNDDGTLAGTGMLSLELVLLDRLGWDLSAHRYATNETIRVLTRTFAPFLILIVISTLTPPEDEQRINRFFAKMKTVVNQDREKDTRELERSYADPHRFDHTKLFPRSNWEFTKWKRVDAVGFALAVLFIFIVLGFMKILISLGS